MAATILEAVWVLVMLIGFVFSLRRLARAEGDLEALGARNGARRLIATGWVEGARYLAVGFALFLVGGMAALVAPTPPPTAMLAITRSAIVAGGLVLVWYVIRGDRVRRQVDRYIVEKGDI